MTTDAHATGVDWTEAKVQPTTVPKPIQPPRWLRLLLLVGIIEVIGLVIFSRMGRRARSIEKEHGS